MMRARAVFQIGIGGCQTEPGMDGLLIEADFFASFSFY